MLQVIHVAAQYLHYTRGKVLVFDDLDGTLHAFQSLAINSLLVLKAVGPVFLRRGPEEMTTQRNHATLVWLLEEFVTVLA